MTINAEDAKAVQQLLAIGRAKDAEPLVQHAVKNAPEDANAWFLLASVMRALDRREEAVAAMQRALLIQPFHPGFHAFQAELHLDARQVLLAEEALKRALAAKQDFLPALALLGVILMDSGRVEEAIEPLRKCVNLKPDSAQHLNNLGACLLATGRDNDAEAMLAQAVRLDGTYFTARYNLARALIKRGADRDAATQLQVLLNQQPDHQDCLFLVGNICHRNGDFATAADFLRRAAETKPVSAPILNAFAEFCWEQGDTATAIELYTLSAQTEPANIRAALGRHLSLPMVADSASAVSAARERFVQGLESVERQLNMPDKRPKAMRLREIQWTNFLLAYQGENDIELQRKYAGMVTGLMKAALPQYAVDRPKRKLGQNAKPRVGFISDHFYTCTAGRYFESWVTGLRSDTFNIHVYNGSNTRDALTHRVEGAAQHVRNVYALDLERLAHLISDDDLDVLVFPEMGMHPQVFALGGLRLARVQVAGWGHPVTTGFAEIDYFLSSAEMEPDNAQSHYTEQLHTLPGLGTCYSAPPSDGVTATRAEFGLPPSGALYLVPQSLFKIHPDNDAILAEVLKLDPTGTLIMFATDRHKVATNVFVKRLQAALERAGVAPAGRVKLLPQGPHHQYLSICRLCDVMIDTVRWSGGNTALDAIAVNLPLVTTEGIYMRGRQSAAMLRIVGAPGLIAESGAQLAQKAVELGIDPAANAAARARINAGKSQLFGQHQPIAALERFLIDITT